MIVTIVFPLSQFMCILFPSYLLTKYIMYIHKGVRILFIICKVEILRRIRMVEYLMVIRVGQSEPYRRAARARAISWRARCDTFCRALRGSWPLIYLYPFLYYPALYYTIGMLLQNVIATIRFLYATVMLTYLQKNIINKILVCKISKQSIGFIFFLS